MDKKNKELTQERKQSIYHAALEEFAQQGYQKASTNTIVEKAGVSKGLLFHHFGSKKALFLYVLNIGIKEVLARFDQAFAVLPEDIIERIIAINIWKLKLSLEEPLLDGLITQAFLDPPEDIKIEALLIQKTMVDQYMPYLTTNIKTEAFKEGIDTKKALGLILLIAEALGENYLKRARHEQNKSQELRAQFIQEISVYLDMVKYGIYKDQKERG